MALGQYVAGMGFSNVGLGIDHAMAHTLSAHYDTPHGVACAMLLPIAMEFNKPVCAERLAKVAVAMGVDTTGMSTDEAADAAIAAVKQLSADVNIPHVCEAMKLTRSRSWPRTPWPTPASRVTRARRRSTTLSSSSRRSARLLNLVRRAPPVSPRIVLGHVGGPAAHYVRRGLLLVLRKIWA